MNPILTKALGYSTVFLLIAVVAMGLWLRADERALGAVPAQIQAVHLEDANTAAKVALDLLAARDKENTANTELALKAQAKADKAHEVVMLGIQHRQDLAHFYFGGASHDPSAMPWASQPVPTSYLLGMCAALGGAAPGCGPPAVSELIGSGAGGGPGALGGDEPARHQRDRKPAAGARQGSGSARQLQRR